MSTPIPGIQYPNLHPDVHKSVKDATRNIYDNLFYLRDQVAQIQATPQSSAAKKSISSLSGIGLSQAFPLPDGSLVNFQFSSAPSIVFINGVAQRPGVDYIQSQGANFVTFSAAPLAGYSIYALILG